MIRYDLRYRVLRSLRKCWVSIFIILVVSLGQFDLSFAGSVFSLKGIGFPSDSEDAWAVSMGGASIASLDNQNFGCINPAILGMFDRVSLTTTFDFEERYLKDGYGNSHNLTDGNLRLFNFAVPLGYGTLGLGLSPYLDVGYRGVENKTYDELKFKDIFEAHGGVHTATVSLGTTLRDRLYYGTALGFFFGRTSENWLRNFESGALFSSQDTLTYDFSGSSGSAGFVLRITDWLNLGGTYMTSIRFKEKETLSTSSGNKWHKKKTLSIPSFSGVGLALKLGKNLSAAVDFKGTIWNRIQDNPPTYLDLLSVNCGFAYSPTEEPKKPYYLRIPVRCGVRWRTLYYPKADTEEALQERAVSFGIGLPLPKRLAMVNMAFEVGKRGSVSTNGLQETFLRQNISLVGWEKWFQRKK